MIIAPSRAGKSVIEIDIVSMCQKYAPLRTIVLDKDFALKIPNILQGGGQIDLTQSHCNDLQLAKAALIDEFS